MIKAAAFATPAATGNLAVTGLGFAPTWALLVAVNATADDTWQTGNSCIAKGIIGTDPAGALFQVCNKIVFDATSEATSSIALTVAIEISSTRTAIGTTPIYSAALVSFDTDGFTLNFTTAVSGYKVFYLAGDHISQAAYKRGAGVVGLTWGEIAKAAFYVGISDTSGDPPTTWNGGAWTALFGCGATGGANENKFVCWSPGYNTNEKYNEIDYPHWGDHWGAADDPFAFGTVIQGSYEAHTSGTDINVTSQGAGAGTDMAMVALAQINANAEDLDVSASVGGTADSPVAFEPEFSLCIGGVAQFRLTKDAAHTGASIGVATADGEQWLVACGTKMGTGAARYQSEILSWMSGWEPYNAPTVITAGTMTILGDGVRFTTTAADDARVLVRHAVFGGGFLPQIYRVIKT